MNPLNQERLYSFGAAAFAGVAPFIPSVEQCESGLKLYAMAAGAVLVTVRLWVELRRGK